MSIAEHLDHATEHLRAANHASTTANYLDGPTTAVVVGNLRELVARLPQLLDHLRRSLRRVDPVEHYDDRPGHKPANTLFCAVIDLDEARTLADALRDQLTSAHNYLGHIGRHLTED